jgi:hypothetical protein
MDEKREVKRPNAAYRLSEKKAEDGQLNFRYSREKRLAKAPKEVQDLYNGDKKLRFSLLGPLIGSKGRAAVFVSIIVMCVASMILSIAGRAGSYDLAGNRVEARALKYDGTIVVVLKKTLKKNAGKPYTGAVEIGAAAALDTAEEDFPAVFLHRVFFTAESVEEYRFSLPFESDNILIILQSEKDTLSMKVKVE